MRIKIAIYNKIKGNEDPKKEKICKIFCEKCLMLRFLIFKTFSHCIEVKWEHEN